MLRYIYADDLGAHAKLQDTMHKDRATQFRDRLKWEVSVDARGWEQDEYDALNPLYVIWEEPDGSHGGSMRFLPTSGRTMVNEHFADLMDTTITSPLIWECTRFCLAPKASSRVAAALMLAGGELMRAFQLTHLRDRISVGLWEYNADDRAKVLLRAGLSSEISENWFNRSFGHPISHKSVA